MVAKLYGNPFSTCTQRVATALHEKNIPYEIVVIDFSKGEHKQPPHLARQPFGQVPVFEDEDGYQIYETRAIIHYLEAKYKGQGTTLIPNDIKQAGQAEQWLSVEYSNYNPAVTAIVSEIVFKKVFGGVTDPARVAENVQKLGAILDVYEKHLGNNEYLANNEFSIADLAHLPYTQLLVTATPHGDLITSRPNVNAWWQRTSSRPSFQKALTLGKH